MTEDMGCPTNLDYAVVLVGYTEEPNTPILDCTTYSIHSCRRARISEKYQNQCNGDLMERFMMKDGELQVSSCCGNREEEVCEVVGEIEGQKYWTVQN